MAAAYVPFLNLQYFYCLIASMIGQVCAKDRFGIDLSASAHGVSNAVTSGVQATANTTQTAIQNNGGFWSWLWPFGHSAATTVTTVSQATATASTDVGFWAGIAHGVPSSIVGVFDAIGTGISFLWTVFSWASYSVSGILFLAILAAALGLAFIRAKEWTDFGTLPARTSATTQSWSRWQDLLNEAMTTDPRKWKTAILAADGMLGELLTRIGYHGATTGEQMRSMPEDAFVTVAQAWEAHRIKNFVASRNSNFILTQREAFRVLKLYEQVFEEFDFI